MVNSREPENIDDLGRAARQASEELWRAQMVLLAARTLSEPDRQSATRALERARVRASAAHEALAARLG